jgi:hypothetical protein
MLTAGQVVDLARERLTRTRETVVGLWVTAGTGDRDQLKAEIEAQRGDMPFVTAILRGRLFEDPNRFSSDFVSLLEQCREDIEHVVLLGTHTAPPILCVLILSRTDLSAPQLGSPAVLPTWFPFMPGEQVSGSVVNLFAATEVALNSEYCQVGELCRELFLMEGATLRRLRLIVDQACSRNQSEIMKLGFTGRDDFRAFLACAESSLSLVRNPDCFRPSARKGDTWVGRVLRMASGSNPDELAAKGDALAGLLQLEEITGEGQSLVGVLLRPTNREPHAHSNGDVARNLLVTIYAGSQLVTAASHADEYPRFSAEIVSALSRDIRLALSRTRDWIERLDAI